MLSRGGIEMSQTDILNIVSRKPGIQQAKIARMLGRHEWGGATARQINQLVKRGELRKEPMKRTFRLFIGGD